MNIASTRPAQLKLPLGQTEPTSAQDESSSSGPEAAPTAPTDSCSIDFDQKISTLQKKAEFLHETGDVLVA